MLHFLHIKVSLEGGLCDSMKFGEGKKKFDLAWNPVEIREIAVSKVCHIDETVQETE